MLLISISMFLGSILSGSVEIQNFIENNIGNNFPLDNDSFFAFLLFVY